MSKYVALMVDKSYYENIADQSRFEVFDADTSWDATFYCKSVWENGVHRERPYAYIKLYKIDEEIDLPVERWQEELKLTTERVALLQELKEAKKRVAELSKKLSE
jgi:hypothetical protein